MLQLRTLLLALTGALLLIAATATGAMAHAGLIATTPAEGSILDAPPSQVVLTFTEPVAPLRFALVSATGETIALPDVVADGAALAVALPAELAHGSYLLSWRVTSEDGHPVNGVVSFAIGSADTIVPTPPNAASLTSIVWVVRTAQYVALFFGLGSLAFAGLVATPASASRGPRGLVILGLALVPVAIALQGLDLIGAGPDALASPEPWLTSLTSSYGHTQIALAAAFVLALAPARWALIAAVAAGVLAPALSGHASSADPRLLMRLAVATHIAALMLWLGALWPLLAELRRAGVSGLRRFSRLIPYGIALLLISGLVLAVVQMGLPGPSWTSPYGLLLMAKLAIVVALLGIALWNRRSLTPAAIGGATAPLRRSIAIEIVLVVAVLGIVAGWRFTAPPRVLDAIAIASSPLSVPLTGNAIAGQITVTPGHTGLVDIVVDLDALVQAVELQVSNPGHDIATLSRAASQLDERRWSASGLLLPVAGNWTVTVKARLDRFNLVTLTTTLPLDDPGKDQTMSPSRLAAAAALAAALSTAPVLSQDVSAQPPGMGHAAAITLGDLEISGAFSRATLPNAPVGAGYLTIVNKGTSDDRLVSAASPMAGVTQIHEMKMEGDVMKMTELPDGLVIPAGGSVSLTPGGYHIMFMQLNGAFVEGTSVPVTLTFEKAGTVDVQLAVGAINADEPSHDMQGM